MRREDALKKIAKLLGKNFRYQVNPKAPDQDDRDWARAKLPDLREACDRLGKRREERIRQLLDNDAEFQQIKAQHEGVKKEREKMVSVLHHYRFCAGVITHFGFFEIKAQGDSWEEVIAEIQRKKERVS